MSGRIGQPVGQVRFTNVAIVRLKRKGKRFEVASYRNKVMSWRNKTETDINEVLQVPTVFTNVSRGIHASGKELTEAFGTDDHLKVAQLILETGEVEVTDKERAALFESLARDIATIIADKCLNPSTLRPYPVSLITAALKEAHFSVAPGKSAKQQALKAIGMLQKSGLPIERAKMRVRLTADKHADASHLRHSLAALHIVPEVDSGASTGTGTVIDDEEPSEPRVPTVIEAVIDPGHYRALEEAVSKAPSAAIAVLSLAAHTDASFGASSSSASGGGGASSSAATGARGGAGGGGDDGSGSDGGHSDGDGDEEEDEIASVDTNPRSTGGARYASISSAALSSGLTSAPAPSTGGKATDSHRPVAAVTSALARSSLAASTAAPAPAPSPSPAPTKTAAADAATAASAAGTGMAVRRVTVPGARALTCNSCGGISFESSAEHRDHFRCDWHRYNLKNKTRGKPPIDQDTFTALPVKEKEAVLNAIE